jgi:hypothetical protein
MHDLDPTAIRDLRAMARDVLDGIRYPDRHHSANLLRDDRATGVVDDSTVAPAGTRAVSAAATRRSAPDETAASPSTRDDTRADLVVTMADGARRGVPNRCRHALAARPRGPRSDSARGGSSASWTDASCPPRRRVGCHP